MKKIINMREDGFTLIEILMAVLIIVILAVVGITQFTNFAADAKDAATKSNLAIMRNAIGSMNALERVRCQKTSVAFPDVGTLQSNDITGCNCTALVAGISGCTAGVGPLLTAVCNPTTLRDPRLGAAYGVSCAAANTAGTNFASLIPPNDRPYVQNQIPNNPWTGPKATTLPNWVNGDTAPAAGAASCLNAPVDTPGAMAIATRCASASAAFNSVLISEAGWCYCQATGTIWANTANNNGLGNGTGVESNF